MCLPSCCFGPSGHKDGVEEEKRERKQRRQKGAMEINLWASQSQIIQKNRQRM